MDETIYTWILIDSTSGLYYDKHITEEIPPYGNDGGITTTSSIVEWVEWNDVLPEDIDTVQYKYENGELVEV